MTGHTVITVNLSTLTLLYCNCYQRPETIMGDTQLCANPNDERYTYLKGKMF